jgi:hypothetical protein
MLNIVEGALKKLRKLTLRVVLQVETAKPLLVLIALQSIDIIFVVKPIVDVGREVLVVAHCKANESVSAALKRSSKGVKSSLSTGPALASSSSSSRSAFLAAFHSSLPFALFSSLSFISCTLFFLASIAFLPNLASNFLTKLTISF